MGYNNLMRHFPRISLLIPALFLSACTMNPFSQASGDSAFSSSGEIIDQHYPVALNGDLYGVSSASTYDEVTHVEDVDTLLRRYDNGESVAFLFTSVNCSHCASWEPTFVSFVLEVKPEIIHYENGTMTVGEYQHAYTSLQTYFGNIDQITGGTPTLFFGKKGAFHYVGAANLSYLSLINAFKNYAQASVLRLFTSYERYQAYLKDNPESLTYLLDRAQDSLANSFYDENLYPRAKTASKSLAVLDYSAMDESNKTATLAGLSLTSFAPLLLQQGTSYDVSKESEKASALSLIASYFA